MTETNPHHLWFPVVSSSPKHNQKLYSLDKGNSGDEAVLEDIMKPMLTRNFDPSNFLDVREKPLTSNLRCSLVTPLQKQPGCAVVTAERLYFQSATGVLGPIESSANHWSVADVTSLARRYNGLRDAALEVYFANGSSILLAFEKEREREKMFRVLPKSLWCHTDRDFVVAVYREWHRGNLTNYDYLLALNSAAGRTFHDLSRYPVFPWVIADYESKSLDWTDPKTYRDLTKPVGALNSNRLQYFLTRYQNMQDMGDPFIYGTHYSAPGYILYYLVRSMPEHMLCLQNGTWNNRGCGPAFPGLQWPLPICYDSTLVVVIVVVSCEWFFFLSVTPSRAQTRLATRTYSFHRFHPCRKIRCTGPNVPQHRSLLLLCHDKPRRCEGAHPRVLQPHRRL